MLDVVTLKRLIKDYRQYQELRHQLKIPADSVRSLAKRSIVVMRQDGFEEGKRMLKDAEQLLKSVQTVLHRQPLLATEGFFKEALEEYVEAVAYYSFLTGVRMKIPSFVPLDTDEVLGGVCDFTGELVRKAMSIADARHKKEIASYIHITQTIHGELSHISFSGKLREKYDNLERNLVRLERIAYEIKLKQ